MIYLIQTIYYIEETKSPLKLLKIGYTGDAIIDKRFSHYKLHNPGCKLLNTILDCSEVIEKALHHYFRDYSYPEYGREWFRYSDEIVGLFRDHKNLVELKADQEIWKFIEDYEKSRNRDKFMTEIKRISSCILKIYYKKYQSKALEILDIYERSISENLELCREDYLRPIVGGEVIDEYIKSLKNEIIIPVGLQDFINTISGFTVFFDEIKYFCTSDIPEKEVALDFLSFKSYIYYIALGPDRLYSLGYNQTKIEKELGIITFDKDNLKSQIYYNFQIGDRMSLSDIKLKLTNIYNNTGYNKTPKAIDLLEYFEVKDFVYYEKSLEGKRKQIRGYELLKIK